MSKVQGGLVVVETHPIQYRVPVYRELEQLVDAPVTMIFGSDFSVSGYYDQEFQSSFAWDTDLLPAGSDYRFLSRAAQGGARNHDEVRPDGLGALLEELRPRAVSLTGYTNPLDRGAIREGADTADPGAVSHGDDG